MTDPDDDILDFNGQQFRLPSWAEWGGDTPTECRSCHAPMLWVTGARSGKAAPINPDGTSHFATCPQADQWRRSHA